MKIIERYQAYADAFEETYIDDDWTRIEPYFAEDAVCEGGTEDAHGRAAVLAQLKAGVDGFDRRMDRRIPEFETPTADHDTLSVAWRVTYEKRGAPDLILAGVEFATFRGDQITRLRDDLDPEAEKAMAEWMATHGAKLAED